MLPDSHEKASLVGRVWRADLSAPSIVIIRDGEMIDVTNSVISVSDFLGNDLEARFDGLQGEKLGRPDDFVLSPYETGYGSRHHSWLAPSDFPVLKACGVTFVQNMIERVIDERTSGDPEKAVASPTRKMTSSRFRRHRLEPCAMSGKARRRDYDMRSLMRDMANRGLI